MDNYNEDRIKTVCRNLSQGSKNEDEVNTTLVEIQNMLNSASVGKNENCVMFFIHNGKLYTSSDCAISGSSYNVLENGQYMRFKVICKSNEHFVKVYEKVKDKFHKVIQTDGYILCVVKL